MKIGYLLQQKIDLSRGGHDGPSNHVIQVVRELRRQGHQVAVVMGPAQEPTIDVGDGPTRLADEVRAALRPRPAERGLRRLQAASGAPYLNLFDSWRFSTAVIRSVHEPDVYLERLSWMGLGGALAAARSRKPLVIEYNGDPIHDLKAKGLLPKGMQLAISKLLMRWVFARAHTILASGWGWREHFIQDWGWDENRVRVLANGTDLVERLPRETLRAFDSQASSKAYPRFVYLGGFQAWQGVNLLLQAVSAYASQGLPGTLTLIGDGPGRAQAEAAAAASEASERVQFTGALTADEYGAILAQSDVGLSPYCGWVEFEGLKLLDYKAAGLPVIASGVGEDPRAIQPGRTGWIVPPCDQQALLAAMIEAAESLERRIEMGKRARQQAENEHGWSHTASRLEHVLTTIVRNPA